MKLKKFIQILPAAILLLIVASLPVALPWFHQLTNNGIYGKKTAADITAISFINTAGEPYRIQSGKFSLLFFGYASCPVICPRALGIMQLVSEKSGGTAMLFVTVDPEHDTPAVLKKMEMDRPGLIALTESKAKIRDILKTFRAYAADNKGEIAHSTGIYLVTPAQEVYIYPYASPDPVKILQDMKSF